MYELLLNWMCTQENLIDEAETIVRREMLVGSAPFWDRTVSEQVLHIFILSCRWSAHLTWRLAGALTVCGDAAAGKWCAANSPACKLPDLCRGHVCVSAHSSQWPFEGDAGGQAGSGMPSKHGQLQLHHHGKATHAPGPSPMCCSV